MMKTGENGSRLTRNKKICPSATLSTTNLTSTDMLSKQGLRGVRPAARLSHCTAIKTNTNPNWVIQAARTAQ